MRRVILLLITLFLIAAFAFAQNKTVKVYHAVIDIPEGSPIKKQWVASLDIPQVTKQPDAVEELGSDDFAGYKAARDIARHSQITKGSLAPIAANDYSLKVIAQYRVYPLLVSKANYEMFTIASNMDIRIMQGGAVSRITSAVIVLGKYEEGGKHYLYISVTPQVAQYLMLYEGELYLSLIKNTTPGDFYAIK